jgi:hypothetical protein
MLCCNRLSIWLSMIFRNGQFIANIDWKNVKDPARGYIKEILIK